jgi:hypothetical protein
MPRLLAVIAVAMALMTQNAIAFSTSFSWAGIAACSSTSPAFRITAAPAGTKQLRFKMVDLNAPNYPHGGSTVACGGPTVARGAISYVGPCPPPGQQAHLPLDHRGTRLKRHRAQNSHRKRRILSLAKYHLEILSCP